MTREQLEHIIRAAAEIADDDAIMIIGSQAVLGQFPQAPNSLLASMEADVFPLHKPERATLIDGCIGEGSPFHETFGYYAQGVGPDTAVLPAGWRDRLVLIQNPNTRGHTGLCVEIHDLLISKYVAGREKDRLFARAAIHAGLVNRDTLAVRLAATPLADPRRLAIAQGINADFEAAQPCLDNPPPASLGG